MVSLLLQPIGVGIPTINLRKRRPNVQVTVNEVDSRASEFAKSG